jgi:hypothetical protein
LFKEEEGQWKGKVIGGILERTGKERKGDIGVRKKGLYLTDRGSGQRAKR